MCDSANKITPCKPSDFQQCLDYFSLFQSKQSKLSLHEIKYSHFFSLSCHRWQLLLQWQIIFCSISTTTYSSYKNNDLWLRFFLIWVNIIVSACMSPSKEELITSTLKHRNHWSKVAHITKVQEYQFTTGTHSSGELKMTREGYITTLTYPIHSTHQMKAWWYSHHNSIGCKRLPIHTPVNSVGYVMCLPGEIKAYEHFDKIYQ